MGESTVIAHALLTIVAITMAGVFAGIVIFGSYEIGNAIQALYKSSSDKMRTDITLAHIAFDSVNVVYTIYVKNTGTTPLSELDRMDVFLGPFEGNLDYYRFTPNLVCDATTRGYWTYNELESTPDDVWSVGEMLEIVVCANQDYGPTVELVLVAPTGAKFTYVETIG